MSVSALWHLSRLANSLTEVCHRLCVGTGGEHTGDRYPEGQERKCQYCPPELPEHCRCPEQLMVEQQERYFDGPENHVQEAVVDRVQIAHMLIILEQQQLCLWCFPFSHLQSCQVGFGVEGDLIGRAMGDQQQERYQVRKVVPVQASGVVTSNRIATEGQRSCDAGEDPVDQLLAVSGCCYSQGSSDAKDRRVIL